MPLDPKLVTGIKYPPERYVDAEILSIAGGSAMNPPPLSLSQLRSVNRIVRLDQLVTSQSQYVNVNAVADGQQYPPNAQALTNNLNDQQADEFSIPALSTISLYVSATSNVTNAVVTYGLWAWAPTIIDKVVAGVPLTDEELALLGRYASVFVPQLYPYELVDRLYRGKDYVFAGILPQSTTGAQNSIASDNPPAGYFDLIREIGVDASVAGTYTLAQQLSNNVLVYINRDIDKPLFSYQAAGYPMISRTSTTGLFTGVARPRIVARKNWNVYLQSGTNGATVANIPYRVVVRRCKEFPLHLAHWGLSGSPGADALLKGIDQTIIDQVKVGVL